MDIKGPHGPFDDLDLDARSWWVDKGENSLLIVSTTKQATSFQLATTVDYFLRDFDFTNMYLA